MKGFLLDAAGGLPQLVDLPAPVAPNGCAVASVLAAGVNPVDLKMADDPALLLPRVVGNEAVVVLDGVRGYAERTVAPHGSFAEQTVVRPEHLIPLPDDVRNDGALAIGIAGLAATMPLTHVAQLQRGETVIVLGATGAVGRIAVQVARLLGAGRVVGAGRNSERLSALRSLGVDSTVALGGDDDVAALLDASAGGADVVLDLVFGQPLATTLQATRPGARVVSVGSSAAAAVTLPFAAMRGRSVLTYSNQLTPHRPKREAYGRLLEHLSADRLNVATQTLPLRAAAQAWTLQRTSPGTKLVLRP